MSTKAKKFKVFLLLTLIVTLVPTICFAAWQYVDFDTVISATSWTSDEFYNTGDPSINCWIAPKSVSRTAKVELQKKSLYTSAWETIDSRESTIRANDYGRFVFTSYKSQGANGTLRYKITINGTGSRIDGTYNFYNNN